MKFTLAFLIISFFAVAHTRLAVGDQAINLQNAPDGSARLKCGRFTYTGHDIYLAAQYGFNLKEAGETRGKSRYPKSFTRNKSRGRTLNFDAKTCPENDDDRMEYPLKNGRRYDGGPVNDNQGAERVIYYHEEGEIDHQGNPQVYYCGIITHHGATGPRGTEGYLMC